LQNGSPIPAKTWRFGATYSNCFDTGSANGFVAAHPLFSHHPMTKTGKGPFKLLGSNDCER